MIVKLLSFSLKTQLVRKQKRAFGVLGTVFQISALFSAMVCRDRKMTHESVLMGRGQQESTGKKQIQGQIYESTTALC